jgi:1-acyl-sn-glycerol-3-phosphate acyltransferase
MKSIGRLLASLYLWGYTVFLTVFFSLLIVLSCPLALVDPTRRFAHRLGSLWARSLIALNPFWRFQIQGAHYLKDDQSYVLVANHASLIDILCLFLLGHPFKWLAKKSLFRIPLFGWAMSVMRYIPLERGQYGSIRQSYGEALEWLRRGVSVVIFPEGTRSRTGEMGRFKSGAFRLAIESGRPVVPVVLAGTRGVISKGSLGFGEAGTAAMSVLPPLPTQGLTLEDEETLRKKVEALIQEELKKTDRLLL